MTAPSATSGSASAGARLLARVGIVLVLVTAAALRFYRLGWGLDQGIYVPDEEFLWRSYYFAFMPPTASSLLEHGMIYPTLYGYLLGLGTALGHAAGALGPAQNPLDAILVARVVSACAGVVSVALAALLAARAYSPRAGFLAAAFAAVLPFEILQVRYASVDVLLGTCATAVVLVAVELAHLGGRSRALLAGVLTGLAFATKYTGLAIAIAPAWAIVEVALRERSLRRFLVLAGVAVVGFLVAAGTACPPCWLRGERLLAVWSWLRLAHVTQVGPLADTLTPSVGWYGRPYLYQLAAALPFALGVPLYATALAGVVRALRRRTVTDRVLLVAVLGYLLAIGASPSAFVRYLEPILPALAVLAARWVAELRVPRALQVALAMGVVAYSLALDVTQVARFTYRQQEGVAEWLAARAAGRGRPLRVAMPRTMSEYFHLVRPLRDVGIEPALRDPGHWLDDAPDAVIVPEWLAVMIRRNHPDLSLTRDLERLTSGDAGYAPEARWRSIYLQAPLDRRLDPAFVTRLEQGDIGFTVYVRKRPRREVLELLAQH